MHRFTDAVTTARRAFREAGYPSAEIAVVISRGDVDAIQKELEVAKAMIHEAFHPSKVIFGMRLVAVVDGVRVYVRES